MESGGNPAVDQIVKDATRTQLRPGVDTVDMRHGANRSGGNIFYFFVPSFPLLHEVVIEIWRWSGLAYNPLSLSKLLCKGGLYGIKHCTFR